jgi:16S rRNA (uracil1498-N3)-methyltransferase
LTGKPLLIKRKRKRMSIDFRSQRLFLRADLRPGLAVGLDRNQANYLLNVLRLAEGDSILVFNGRDGEWRARVAETGRKTSTLVPQEQVRRQQPSPDLFYLFAPLKHARLDYMVQKAVEMGAARLCPVLTQHTQVARVNLDRMEANVIEAAEQCGILTLPIIDEPRRIGDVLEQWDAARRLVFCDEATPTGSPVEALGHLQAGPAAVLVGPEGGFSPEERSQLLARPYVTQLSLGPRIMRADTAAIAALTLVQAFIGDWR